MPFRSFWCVALKSSILHFVYCKLSNEQKVFINFLVCFGRFVVVLWLCLTLFRFVPYCSALFYFVPLCSALFCFVWPCSTFSRLVSLRSFLFRFVLLCSALVFFTLLNLVGSNAALCNHMSPFTKYLSFLIQLKD